MLYLIELRDRIYSKRYGFLSFAENMGKNLTNKYGQKLLDSTKKPTTAEATGDLIDNKIADKITSISAELCSMKKAIENNNSNNEAEVPKERYISPEKRQQIVDELRLVPMKELYF